MEAGKVKLVVVNEDSLGHIYPHDPLMVTIISALRTRGSYFTNGESYYVKFHQVRLANESDFDTFRVSFEWIKRNPEGFEFEQQQTTTNLTLNTNQHYL